LLFDGQLPDFSGKHVMFFQYGGKDSTYLLQDVTFERYDGRLFVEGRLSDALPEGTWSRGMSASIAWENIRSYLVYESVEDYRHRQSISKKSLGSPISRFLCRRK
jgi:hypothetical protein